MYIDGDILSYFSSAGYVLWFDAYYFLAESQGFSQTASQSDVLRKPFRFAWTLRYCMLHRSLQLNAQALSCSNPIDLKKNTPFQAYFLAESQGFEPWVRLRTQHFECCTIDHSDNSPCFYTFFLNFSSIP